MVPAVQVWVNTDSMQNVGDLAVELDKEVKANADKWLKAFVIFINPNAEPTNTLTKELQKLAADRKLDKVAFACLSGPKDDALPDYQIVPDAKLKNVVFVYKNKLVDSKFVNLVADSKGLKTLDGAIESVVKGDTAARP